MLKVTNVIEKCTSIQGQYHIRLFNAANHIMFTYIISYIGFMQVIRADMTCLGFIFPELKACIKPI